MEPPLTPHRASTALIAAWWLACLWWALLSRGVRMCRPQRAQAQVMSISYQLIGQMAALHLLWHLMHHFPRQQQVVHMVMAPTP